jgi:hypothetical protein
MARLVEPELLDSLSPEDPAAVRSRIDLRRVNWWMRNESHMVRAILSLPSFPTSLLELGAGDGTFILGVARRLARTEKSPVRIYLLDMEPVVSEETLAAFESLNWKPEVIHQKIDQWLASPQVVDLVTANLFLHHFSDHQLRTYFQQIAACVRSFVSVEPRRWCPSLVGSRLLGLIGCNYVTRHDAVVSVRAGFRERELSTLWPAGSSFTLCETEAGLASHIFCAKRNDPFNATPI